MSKPTIRIMSDFKVFDGYGSMSDQLAQRLHRRGYGVHLAPLKLEPKGLSVDTQMLLGVGDRLDCDWTLYSSWLRPEYDQITARRLAVYTMWESNKLPAGWADRLNRATFVMTPTRFTQESMRASGVIVPVEVVPEGVDTTIYHLVERPEKDTFTTLIVGTPAPRKHLREAIIAWSAAFENDRSARLIMKVSGARSVDYAHEDSRISVIGRREISRGIKHWYEQADILLALGSEGFGLPVIEAMATGIPAIALNSEGQRDIVAAANNLVLPVPAATYVKPASSTLGLEQGLQGVPDTRTAAEWLLWARSNREQVKIIGVAASKWVLEHRTLDQKVEIVETLLREYS